MSEANRPSASRPAEPHPKMALTGQKRLLALDGGGIRGIITLEMLARIEKLLREKRSGDENFRLCDYFDYVAGTSTGAIIATCVSLGMSVKQIQDFYAANGEAMFDRASFLHRIHYKFGHAKLAVKLRDVFDSYLPQAERERGDRHLNIGSTALKTLLLIVMRNATTDSPWPVSNNPMAKYNAPGRENSNANLPLWQLVRASTAAPTYFPPEPVEVGDKRFLFVDGGVTTYNNPAFLLFVMSTLAAYKVGWETGVDRMLLVSVGTGTAADAADLLKAGDMHLLYNATSIPGALMHAALNEQDMLCRAFGRCRAGAQLDREIEALLETDPNSMGLPKLFTYMRYNADLSHGGLAALKLGHIAPEQVQQMDSTRHIPQLKAVGSAAADQISAAHFDGFA
jgi:hypothetical protein